MKKVLPPHWFFLRRHLAVAALIVCCMASVLNAAHRNGLPVDKYGAPVIDDQGRRIKYDRKTLEAMARPKCHWMIAQAGTTRTRTPNATPTPRPRPTPPPRPTPSPPPIGPRPFWQYAVFGSDIGSSNILVGPMPQNGSPEIIIGGYAYSGFGKSPKGYSADNFWQAIRHNPASGGYDQVFVSRIYEATNGNPFVDIKRIGLAHVTSTSGWQIVVMLDDGRIYLYDFATKAELGYLDTGISGLRGLSLTDLDGDGRAELLVTDDYNLYVFNGSGQLLWQVAEAGGPDVVAGRMDKGTSLKIATTSGKVIDALSHGIVWNYQNGFGFRLKLAPFPGEDYQQLIAAEPWNYVYAYDVGRQLPRWSIYIDDNIGAFDVADVEGDGVPEVLVGEGQLGGVHVYDLNTQAEKWVAQAGFSGVNSIAVGDVDRDGVAELLWAAGAFDSGPDHLYVTRTTGAHDVKWQSIDLEGPFLGPVIGDLDGDGQPELVICSFYSNAGYDSGRILVFDLATLALRAISDPVVDDYAWTGVHDLKLRDVNGDGRMEIVIGADYLYDGTIEIYRFDSDNTFTRIWTNATRPTGSPFNFVEVADLDNNGAVKIIGGNSVADTGSEGVYVYAYDYPSGTQSWRSVNLASNFNAITGLVVEDFNGDGNKEIAALVSTGDLYTWDGPTRQLRNVRQGTNGVLLSNQATSAGLVLGDTSGAGHFLQWSNDSYTETFTRQLATDCDLYAFTPCLNGLNVTSDDSLWTGTRSIINQRLAPLYGSVAWQSPEIGDNFGRFVATTVRNGQNCVFSSALHAVVGLAIQQPAPTPTPNPRATPRPRPTPPPRP